MRLDLRLPPKFMNIRRYSWWGLITDSHTKFPWNLRPLTTESEVTLPYLRDYWLGKIMMKAVTVMQCRTVKISSVGNSQKEKLPREILAWVRNVKIPHRSHSFCVKTSSEGHHAATMVFQIKNLSCTSIYSLRIPNGAPSRVGKQVDFRYRGSDRSAKIPNSPIFRSCQQLSLGFLCLLHILQFLDDRERDFHNASHPSRHILLIRLLSLQNCIHAILSALLLSQMMRSMPTSTSES